VAFVNSVYLLSLVIWIGGIIFFSFLGAPAIFKTLPPEQAGKAVGAIFPKYYPMGYISGAVAFFCTIFSAARTGHWPLVKILLLLSMITLTVYSSLVTHPKARALREEIQTATGNTDVTILRQEFERVHRISVIHNGIVLCLGVLLIIATAMRLQI
jgi:uncharacterized membrane protein